jgi:hypothetical protein
LWGKARFRPQRFDRASVNPAVDPLATIMATCDPHAVPRFLIANTAMGGVLGVMFGLSVLATDTPGMRSLIDASGDVVTASIVFLLGSALMFTPLVLATAVGTLDREQ